MALYRKKSLIEKCRAFEDHKFGNRKNNQNEPHRAKNIGDVQRLLKHQWTVVPVPEFAIKGIRLSMVKQGSR